VRVPRQSHGERSATLPEVPLRRTLTGIATGLFLTVAATIAAFADLPSSIATLKGAISTRIATIGTPSTKPLKAELKGLKSAAKALAKYNGTLEIPDLNQLRLAGKGIGTSKTLDPGVVMAGTAAVNDLLAELQLQEDQLYSLADQFTTLRDRDELDRLIALARVDAASATAIAATDVPGALAFARAAGVKYYKAFTFANGVVEAIAEQKQPVLFSPFLVINGNGKPFKVTLVEMDVIFTPMIGMTRRITVDLADYEIPASGLTFPYSLPNGDATFPMYPLMFAALEGELGSSPVGGTIHGSLHFKSTKHGTVDIPVTDFSVFNPDP
jgi:hypothetical protein